MPEDWQSTWKEQEAWLKGKAASEKAVTKKEEEVIETLANLCTFIHLCLYYPLGCTGCDDFLACRRRQARRRLWRKRPSLKKPPRLVFQTHMHEVAVFASSSANSCLQSIIIDPVSAVVFFSEPNSNACNLQAEGAAVKDDEPDGAEKPAKRAKTGDVEEEEKKDHGKVVDTDMKDADNKVWQSLTNSMSINGVYILGTALIPRNCTELTISS